MRWLPNGISLLRILLVVPTVSAVLRGEHSTALGLVAVAAVSDALDGFLARRFDWRSQLGALLDPIADKLLVAGLYLTLTFIGALPVWLLVVVLTRDVVIVAGAACYRYFVGPLEMAPTRVSKANTAAQFVLVLLALVVRLEPGADWSELLRSIIDPWGFVLVTITCCWSGALYVRDWSRRAGMALR